MIVGIPFWFGKQPAQGQSAVVAIGVFDGVHVGHREIVATAKLRSIELALPLIVLTFEPHPTAVLAPDRQPSMLTTVAYRAELLLGAGADAVVVWPFTKEFASYTPARFVDETLVESLGAKVVFVGTNFTYGNKASGDVGQLRSDGLRAGFEVVAMPLLTGGAAPFSSTLIRSWVEAGDLQRAWELLARPHCVTHLHTGRRCVCRLALGRGRAMASRDFSRNQSDLRWPRASGRGLRLGSGGSRALRSSGSS
jgi:riboflavin kinase/FMN adenylyltransferase